MPDLDEHWQANMKPHLDTAGLTLDELTDAVPLRHYGPGGCNGVDLDETYEQILLLISKVLEAKGNHVRPEP